jgi:ubiquinol-cytochrome c reductase core subunit 2
MISRSAIGKTAQRVARAQSARGYASAASAGTTSFNYESADVNGIKVASRNIAGPTTKLAVVARAGSRYELLPGLTSGLEQFAFKVSGIRMGRALRRTES